MIINTVILNEMKTGNIFYIVLLILMCGCAQYPAYEITNPPFVNKTSLNMYVGDEVQLTASPINSDFRWLSDNEEIVQVSQTGLVTAVGEGLATIAVASDNAKTNIDVRVKIFVPLTDISLPTTTVRLYAGDQTQIWAYPVPENASDVTLSWRSEDPEIAKVNKDGQITAVSKGITHIIVSCGSVEQAITVNIPELYLCDKTGWSIEVSDEHTEGGGKDRVIDGNYSVSGYWHSMYRPDAPLPHWAVIDMINPVEVTRIITQRRNNGDTKTLQYFIGNSPDPDGEWTKIAEGMYASASANHTLSLNLAEPVTGRYIKLVLPDSYRPPYTGICEIDVYGLEY
jgi:hypothetical protein